MTDGESGGTADGPDRIRSVAVHREDVASALEATLRSDREVVLRVTPPFSGRMRARLHAVDAVDASATDSTGGGETGETEAADGEPGDDGDGAATPIHIGPRDLVAAVPPYPEVDETAAAHPDADVETRRERHAEAVAAWRESVRESVVETVELTVAGERREVDVTALG